MERGVNNDNSRSDVCARGFWVSGQMVFYDVKGFQPIGYEIQRSRTLSLTKRKRRRLITNESFVLSMAVVHQFGTWRNGTRVSEVLR